jgi:putative SOS response-associated peptidase YedK
MEREKQTMCCRYYFDQDSMTTIQRITQNAGSNPVHPAYGDVHPSDHVPIIAGKQDKLYAADMIWGMKNQKSNQLLINARAETVLEKPSFSYHVMHRRCVIVARHFYEWDRSRVKVTFTLPAHAPIYMAGFYQEETDGSHFVILTTGANASMQPVHDRMPLILKEQDLQNWICEDILLKDFLSQPSPMLERKQDYEQLTLF